MFKVTIKMEATLYVCMNFKNLTKTTLYIWESLNVNMLVPNTILHFFLY